MKAWSAWILGPAAWALHLAVSYALVPWLCGPPWNAWLHALAALFLLAALAGVALGWSAWRRAREERESFLALTGLMLSALFAAVVLAQSIPGLVLPPCAISALAAYPARTPDVTP